MLGGKTFLRGIGSILAAVSADELLISVASGSIKSEADLVYYNYRKVNTNYLISLSKSKHKKNVIKEVNKRECIMMVDFNNGHIQLKFLENRGVNTKHFYS